jgi:hypothetical protein
MKEYKTSMHTYKFRQLVPPQALNSQSIPAIVCFAIPGSALRVTN